MLHSTSRQQPQPTRSRQEAKHVLLCRHNLVEGNSYEPLLGDTANKADKFNCHSRGLKKIPMTNNVPQDKAIYQT